MPLKKKKYNARFPAGRIKKIMQTDEEVGKVAQAVPVIISRTLELFVESLLTKSMQITQARNAKTLTPSHMKQCILSESRFDFLKDLVKSIPDASTQEDNENNANEALDYTSYMKSEDESIVQDLSSHEPKPEIVANFYTEQSTSAARTPVIQYGPKVTSSEKSSKFEPHKSKTEPKIVVQPKINISLDNLSQTNSEPKIQINVLSLTPSPISGTAPIIISLPVDKKINNIAPNSSNPISNELPPPLIPISQNCYAHNSGDSLYIDEDYDN